MPTRLATPGSTRSKLDALAARPRVGPQDRGAAAARTTAGSRKTGGRAAGTAAPRQNRRKPSAVDKDATDLVSAVDKLAAGGGPLRQAAEKLQNAIQSKPYRDPGPGRDEVRKGPAVISALPVVYTGGVGAVVLALQAKIQEIMLDSELADRDGPVPPQYKAMVEDYYRVLSQDLR